MQETRWQLLGHWVAVWLLAQLWPLSAMALTESDFGAAPDGQIVKQYKLSNARGTEVYVLSYGATLRAWNVLDGAGKAVDVVLGYDTLPEYLEGRGYFGATVGRYANRIANAQFELEGRSFKLTANSGVHTLHGGARSFSKVVWMRDDAAKSSGDSVTLKYVSADGEEGFPGELTVRVTYTLTAASELRIDYEARTTAATVVNLTNHSYFSLRGAGEGDVRGQTLRLDADRLVAVGSDKIPTGQLTPVNGTPFDFRKGGNLGEHIDKLGTNFDHQLMFAGRVNRLRHLAELREPSNGLTLSVSTTEPGLQLYTANFAAGRFKGKSGKAYDGTAAVCLETQHAPDSPHFSNFPSTVLKPGETFRSTTVYAITKERR